MCKTFPAMTIFEHEAFSWGVPCLSPELGLTLTQFGLLTAAALTLRHLISHAKKLCVQPSLRVLVHDFSVRFCTFMHPFHVPTVLNVSKWCDWVYVSLVTQGTQGSIPTTWSFFFFHPTYDHHQKKVYFSAVHFRHDICHHWDIRELRFSKNITLSVPGRLSMDANAGNPLLDSFIMKMNN